MAPDAGSRSRDPVPRESGPFCQDQAVPALWSGLMGCDGRQDVLAAGLDVNPLGGRDVWLSRDHVPMLISC